MPLADLFSAKPARTFGSLKFDRRGGCWVAKAEPHVSMELKRLFPGFRQDAQGLAFSDSPETAMKLAWLLLMFPLEMPRASEKHLRGRTEERFAMRARVEKILQGGQLALMKDAFESSLPLYPHQKTAAALAVSTGGLLLLDETGAMKTGSALAAAAHPDLLPAVVVAPPHLQRQWLRELHRFFPMLRGHIITSGTVYDPARRRGMRGHDPDVLITSYGMLPGWVDYLQGRVRTVILEEAHEVRREGTNKRDACRVLTESAALNIGLTATPVFNYGDEIFNILELIAPGMLGERREFYAEWCQSIGQGKYKVKEPQGLGSHLRDQGVVLRRSLKEVGVDIPKLVPMPFEIDVDGDRFDRLAADAVQLAERIVARIGTPFEQMRAAQEFDMQMRKATGVAKAPAVAALCKMLLADPAVGKLVLFGWHRDVYEIWLEQLAQFNPAMYTGTESLPQKEASKARFLGGTHLEDLRRRKGLTPAVLDYQGQDPTHREANILVISLRSGSGLDGLQHVCHTVVHGELDWSPAPHDQGDGRLDRPGQTIPVLSYRPFCDYGTDPLMLERLAEKRQQGEGITTPDKGIFEPSNADPDQIRKVAEAFLEHAGRTTVENDELRDAGQTDLDELAAAA